MHGRARAFGEDALDFGDAIEARPARRSRIVRESLPPARRGGVAARSLREVWSEPGRKVLTRKRT